MTRTRNGVLALVIGAALSLGLALPAAAEQRSGAGRGFCGTRPQRSGWVPQAAWDAIKERAGLDLGSNRVKLYKSGWSRSLSRGLKGNLGSDTRAFVVHARAFGNHPAKRKGNYLAVKSSQGHYEVFPLALAADAQGRPARGKHITAVDTRRPVNNTYAFADGRLPGSKVVQAVKAGQTRMALAHEGHIVASKQRGTTKTFFLLGDPNRQGDAPAATGHVSLYKNPLMMQHRTAQQQRPAAPAQQGILPGGCVVNAPGYAPMRTKFIDLPQPAIAPILPVAAR
ncbi:MAG: hypothetical protein JRI55_00430 [Deltaproteobacteria bacterium]|jgi:hypothetical protein|nr:hypothetical protein [Deltaproteobacteria bacterium]